MIASWKCIAAAEQYSAGKRKNDSIKISVGLAGFAMWVVRGVDIFGDMANVAFELGENMASKEVFAEEAVLDLSPAIPASSSSGARKKS